LRPDSGAGCSDPGWVLSMPAGERYPSCSMTAPRPDDPPSRKAPPRRPPPRPSPPSPGAGWTTALTYALLVVGLVWLWQRGLAEADTRVLSYREFKRHLAAGELADLRIGEEEIEGVLLVPPAPPETDREGDARP